MSFEMDMKIDRIESRCYKCGFITSSAYIRGLNEDFDVHVMEDEVKRYKDKVIEQSNQIKLMKERMDQMIRCMEYYNVTSKLDQFESLRQ